MWISGARREKKTGYLYLLLLYDYTILLMCRRFSAWYAWSVKRVSPPLPKYSCSVHCCRCTNLFFVSGTTIAEITRQSGKVGDCSNHSMLWCANKRYKRRLSSRSPSHSTFRWAIQPPFHSSLCDSPSSVCNQTKDAFIVVVNHFVYKTPMGDHQQICTKMIPASWRVHILMQQQQQQRKKVTHMC